jgi:ATP-dependent exoDNAse (exonuclease V) alpha subunit
MIVLFVDHRLSAATVHKAQGRTMPRAILALLKHNVALCKMIHPSMFVAVTRVKQRDHLRMLNRARHCSQT